MFSFRSLALIVLGAPFLSACIENACDLPQYKDMSFCQATDMSMSQSADDKAGDMAMPTKMCQYSNGVCTCTLQFGTEGLSVKGVAMKRVDMNSSRLALLLEGGMSTIVDVASVSNACSILSNRTHNATTAASGESSMAASRSFILFARDNILASSPWDLDYVDYYQKYTGKHLSVASNVNGSVCAMVLGSDETISASSKSDFSGNNLAAKIVDKLNKKIIVGVQGELLVWNVNGSGTRYLIGTDGYYFKDSNQSQSSSVINLSCGNGKLCPVAAGDINSNGITDLITADGNGIHVYNGNGSMAKLEGFIESNDSYAERLKQVLKAETAVQAIAVEIPSGVNASDPPRLVWATAENDTNAKQTKVTVKILTLTLLTQ